MWGKPLDAFAESIRDDPRCSDFAVARKVKTLYRAIADEGPIEVLALTHNTVVGTTLKGRLLVVVWVDHPAGRFPVHARQAGRRAARRYYK